MENFTVETKFYETEKPKHILVFNYYFYFKPKEIINFVVLFDVIKEDYCNLVGQWNVKLKTC